MSYAYWHFSSHAHLHTHSHTHTHTHTHTLTSLTLTQSVVEHSYSGMFGTFITDSEKEQKQVEILILCINLVKVVARWKYYSYQINILLFLFCFLGRHLRQRVMSTWALLRTQCRFGRGLPWWMLRGGTSTMNSLILKSIRSESVCNLWPLAAWHAPVITVKWHFLCPSTKKKFLSFHCYVPIHENATTH